MTEGVTTDNSAEGPVELITLAEFDRRMHQAWPWMTMMGILVIADVLLIPVIIILLLEQMIMYASLAIILLFLSIIIVVFLYKYSVRRFELYCPCCKKALQGEFNYFKSYIRRKGRFYIDSNPFISGRCRECGNMIIEIDPELNRCLQERCAKHKANRSYMNGVCMLLIFIAFVVIVNTAIENDDSDDQKPENMDLYSARKQVEEGDFQQAKTTLAYILLKEPNYSEANQLLGYIHLQEDELDQALHRYRKARPYSEDTDTIDSAIRLINQRLREQQ